MTFSCQLGHHDPRVGRLEALRAAGRSLGASAVGDGLGAAAGESRLGLCHGDSEREGVEEHRWGSQETPRGVSWFIFCGLLVCFIRMILLKKMNVWQLFHLCNFWFDLFGILSKFQVHLPRIGQLSLGLEWGGAAEIGRGSIAEVGCGGVVPSTKCPSDQLGSGSGANCQELQWSLLKRKRKKIYLLYVC